MNRSLLGVIIAVIVIVGVVLFMNNNATAPTTENENVGTNPSPTTPNPTTPNPTSPNPTTPNPSTPMTHSISMTDSGYTPSTLSIKKGDTVTFTNNGTMANWPASAPHPSHTDYPSFDPKAGIAVGKSWSFKFDQVGTWRFHDHLNPTRFGSITVTE